MAAPGVIEQRIAAAALLRDSAGQSGESEEAMLVSQIIKDKGGAVFIIAPAETVASAARLLREKRIGALVVSEADGEVFSSQAPSLSATSSAASCSR